MSEQTNKAVVRAVLDALDRQDLEALREHPGLYETVQYIPNMWAAFPDMRHTVELQFADGNMVATCVEVRGTHQGAFMGAAPSGRDVSFLVLMMNRVEDGKIVLHYGLPDWMAILPPIGVMPDLAPA